LCTFSLPAALPIWASGRCRRRGRSGGQTTGTPTAPGTDLAHCRAGTVGRVPPADGPGDQARARAGEEPRAFDDAAPDRRPGPPGTSARLAARPPDARLVGPAKGDA